MPTGFLRTGRSRTCPSMSVSSATALPQPTAGVPALITSPPSALDFPGLGIVVLATLVMRRVRRSIPLVQEMRADADACRGAPDGLRAALAGLPKAHDTPWLRARLAVLDDRESARWLHRLRRWLWAGWLGYVIPVAGCTAVAIWVRL